MKLTDKIIQILEAEEIRVSEWLVTDSSGKNIRPPYVCVMDEEGSGVWADGICIIPTVRVSVHAVFREDDKRFFEQVRRLLAAYGGSWKKEKYSAERVLIATLEINGTEDIT